MDRKTVALDFSHVVAIIIGALMFAFIIGALMFALVFIEENTRMKYYLQFVNLMNLTMLGRGLVVILVLFLVFVAVYYYWENVKKTKKIQEVKQMTQNEPTYEFLQYTLDYIEGKITPDDLKKRFQEYEEKSDYVRKVLNFFESKVQKNTLDAIKENGDVGKFVREITLINCLSDWNCRKKDTCPFFHGNGKYPRIPSVEDYHRIHQPHLKEYPNHLYPVNLGKNPKDYPKNQKIKNFNTPDNSSGKKSKKLEKTSKKSSEKSEKSSEKPSGSNVSQVDTSETNIKPL